MEENKKWYIVNVQSSCEQTAKNSLLKRIETSGMQEHFGDILIPQEEVTKMERGKKRTRTKKFYPGYMFVNMDMSDKTWHLVRGTTKVTGFLGGGTSSAKQPTPVPEADVLKVTKQMQEGTDTVKIKADFTLGEEVTVIDGPFNNFNGTVEEINEEKSKVKVLVSIFGRPTPVELDFAQVERN